MSEIEIFDNSELEKMAKILGEAGSRRELRELLQEAQIKLYSPDLSRQKFLKDSFIKDQKEYRCGNHILTFIRITLNPRRFIDKEVEFEHHRTALNKILKFKGLEYTNDSQFRRVEKASSLDDLPKKWEEKLKQRGVHAEIFKYCTVELLQDDIYHAVFEASKGLLERIRQLSEVHMDGVALIDKVFSTSQPILVFNTLTTQTEKSEQTGFINLLKSICSLIRNPLAHEPRLLWEGEENALDWFSLLSLAHKMLDKCSATCYKHYP